MAARTRAAGTISLVVLTSLGLSFGLVSPAVAAPDVPSWSDIEAAKANEAATQAQIDRVVALLGTLEETATEYGRVASERGEAYQVANDELEAATGRAERLTARADAAATRATVSSQAAGQLIAKTARSSGGNITIGLLFSGDDADDLLNQLGAVGKLTAQARATFDQATLDANTASALTDQAHAAEKERLDRAETASEAFEGAQQAADTASARVAEQSAAADQLYDQLASLKGTTAEAERAYLAEIARQKAEAALGVVPSAPAIPASPSTPSAPGEIGTTPSSPSTPTPGTTTPATPGTPSTPGSPAVPAPATSTAPAPVVTAPVVTAPVPAPAPAPVTPTAPVVSAPNVTAVAGAIAYARSQLGDAYRFAGAGPDAWDCSGLTKAAYASVGTYIGTHSATNQYNTLKRAGRLVPLSAMVAGDLLWYSSGGSASADKYHVAIYIGGGQMIEAPYEGQVVRVTAVRRGDLVQSAGRPTP